MNAWNRGSKGRKPGAGGADTVLIVKSQCRRRPARPAHTSRSSAHAIATLPRHRVGLLTARAGLWLGLQPSASLGLAARYLSILRIEWLTRFQYSIRNCD